MKAKAIMVMEEQIAQSVLSACMQGATLILRVSGKAANILASATSTSISKIGKTTKDTLRQGRESVVKLTKKTGGDLHFTESLSREDMRSVRAQLHKYGLQYGIEKNADAGKYYIVFKGTDADMVKHSLERALDKVGGKVAVEPVVVPKQSVGINKTAEDVAIMKASDLMPETVPAGGPQFTMKFTTVEWDRDTKIISDNLTKLGIPYTMTDAENEIKNFAFPQSCSPAVKQFIDTYSQSVPGFTTNRVVNYDQLGTKATAPEQAEPAKGKTPEAPAPRRKKTVEDVRREIKHDTDQRIAHARGEAPMKTASKTRTR